MQKSIIDIAIDFSSSSRFLFSTMIITVVVVATIFVLIPSYFSSVFVFGADPGMAPSPPPTTTPSPPPATTTGEKPGIVPVPPPPPTASTAIDKLLGLQKTPPIVEKIDPKDGDTILSSKTDDGTITVATKIDDKSTMVTKDYNRGYVRGIIIILGEDVPEVPPEELRYRLERLLLDDPTSEFLKPLKKRFSEEYIRGISQGLRDALKLGDLLGTIPTKNP